MTVWSTCSVVTILPIVPHFSSFTTDTHSWSTLYLWTQAFLHTLLTREGQPATVVLPQSCCSLSEVVTAMLSPWFYAAKTLYCLVADCSDLRLTLNFLVGSYCLGTVFPQTIDTGSLTTRIMHISIYRSCTQSSKGGPRTRNQERVTNTKRSHKQKTFCAVFAVTRLRRERDSDRVPLASATR